MFSKIKIFLSTIFLLAVFLFAAPKFSSLFLNEAKADFLGPPITRINFCLTLRDHDIKTEKCTGWVTADGAKREFWIISIVQNAFVRIKADSLAGEKPITHLNLCSQVSTGITPSEECTGWLGVNRLAYVVNDLAVGSIGSVRVNLQADSKDNEKPLGGIKAGVWPERLNKTETWTPLATAGSGWAISDYYCKVQVYCQQSQEKFLYLALRTYNEADLGIPLPEFTSFDVQADCQLNKPVNYLSWSANNADTYTIFRNKVGENIKYYDPQTGTYKIRPVWYALAQNMTATNFTDKDIISGLAYRYQIVAENKAGVVLSDIRSVKALNCEGQLISPVNVAPLVSLACEPASCEGYYGVPRGLPGSLDIIVSATDSDNNLQSCALKIDNIIVSSNCDLRRLVTNYSQGIHTALFTALDTEGLSNSKNLSFRIKKDIRADFLCSLDKINFKDCAQIEPLIGQKIYLKDNSNLSEGAAFISYRLWSASEGSPSPVSAVIAEITFSIGGWKDITLKVIDNKSRGDTITKVLNLGLSLPQWQEVIPR